MTRQTLAAIDPSVSDALADGGHLALIVPRSSYRTGAFLDACRRLGTAVTVCTDAATAVAGSAIGVDLTDPRVAAVCLDDMLGPVDGVVGTDGPAMAAAAHLAARRELRSSTPDAVEAATDKLAQRRACASANVAQPPWVVFSGGSRPGDSSASHLWEHGPVVVKPTDRSGGQGVILATSADEVTTAAQRVRRLVGPEASLLVERYVEGREVAVDALLVGGRLDVLAVFDKPVPDRGPYFEETMLIRPGRLRPAVQRAVVDVVAAAVAAVGLTEGPVHAEVRIDHTGEIWFLELAPRSIGGLCSRLIRPEGRPLEELLVQAALGRVDAAPVVDDDVASGVFMLPVPAAGQLVDVNGCDRARAVPGITGVDITIGPGEPVLPLPDGDRYLGFVFAEAEVPDQVEVALRAAVDFLDVRISER